MIRSCGGRRVEILSERSEYAQVFLNADGSSTLEQSVEPQRVRRGTSWVPVDTRLTATIAGVAPQATLLPMTFSGGGDALVGKLRDAGRELAVSWPGTLPKPTLAGSTAVYKQVLPGVDLRVDAQATGFSEVLVVHSSEAAANPKLASLTFGLATKGVKVVAGGGGGLEARDAAGRPVFTAPAPLMWDSTDLDKLTQLEESTPPDLPAQPGVDTSPRGALEHRAVMPLKVTSGAVTITPSRAMLADPRTRFPVYIDPSVTGGLVSNEWTSVWSKHPTSSFFKNTTALSDGSTYGSAGAGRTEDCDGCADHIIRSLFRMDTSKVKSTQILSAQFRIEQKHAWTCSPVSNAKVWLTGGFSSATTWKNQPTWNSAYTAQTRGNRKNGAVHGCLGPGTIEFNVKSIVALAASRGWNSTSLGLRAVDEGTLTQWKRFNPSTAKLAITYNRAPGAASARSSDGKACATGAARPYVLWPTPVLAAKQSDPDTDQQNLTTDFYWWPVGGARSEANKVSQAAGNPSTVSKAIPAGRLTDGGSYVWQAKTSDGSLSTWSGTCEFTVDATPPLSPGPITSIDYLAGSFKGGVGIAGTFKIAAPATRPQEVVAYAWTLDSGVLLAAQTVPVLAGYTGSVTTKPLHDGTNVLRVWAKDRAGRYSATPSTYTFLVRAGVGPAAEWTFDEDAGSTTAADISQHGNALTLGGNAVRVAGRAGVGSALSVNGTTGFAATTGPATYPNPDTGAATLVRTDSSFTVTARVKLSSTTGVTGQRTAIAQSGSRTSAYTLGYSGADNRWRFAMAGSDADNAASYQVLSNAAPVAGKWTHLGAVYNASTKKLTLYVNGVAQTATATLTGGFNATGAVTVGKRRWNGADDGFLSGAIDDARVYSFAETAAKIAELALPLQPVLTLPNGDEATAGGTLSVTFTAGGDTNVTKVKYSVGDTSLSATATLTTVGGAVTVAVPVGAVTGARPVYAVGVDDGNRVSLLTQTQITVKPAASFSGTVLDIATWLPVRGATVKLQPGSITATTDEQGGYTFAGVLPGFYTVAATLGGRCGTAGSQQFEVDGQGLTLDVFLSRVADNLGNTCTERTTTFATGTTVLPLTGDDAVTTVNLPFAFPYYGGAYRTAWVDTNGLLTFTDPGGSHPYTGSQTLISGAVAPFWDDLVVDASASVRTAIVGSGATQQVVVEWRNVYRKANTAQRLSFSVTLAPDGTVTTNYAGLDNAAEQGDNALVGIESPDGDDGLGYSAGDPVLADGQAIVFVRPDVDGSFGTHKLNGTLTDAAGQPAAGMTVMLDPSGLTTTTAADGTYSFPGLVDDSYSVTTRQDNRCADRAEAQVDLTADTVRDLQLGVDHGSMGYDCTLGAAGYIAAGTVVPLTAEQYQADVTLPFAMRLYGRSATVATVDLGGRVLVGGVKLAVFGDSLVVDGSAGLRTQVEGSAPNRSFVIEWRNVLLEGSTERVTFELILYEDGHFSYQYAAMTSARQSGSNAVIGMHETVGRIYDFYSVRDQVLTADSSITWTPAAPGPVSGILTEAGTAEPLAGKTITLNPGNRTATTATDGSYRFDDVSPGAYQVLAQGAGDRCLGQYAMVEVFKTGGDATADMSLNYAGDGYYDCTTASEAYVPATVDTGWHGDETMWKATAPFPIKLYGDTTTTPWISDNGVISLGYDTRSASWITPIPSRDGSNSPDAAVYAFWDDWVVDDEAAIRTSVTGTAPDRRWTVEWHNVASYMYGDGDRVSFEAVFDENGGITFAYDGIDPGSMSERGAQGTVGLENPDGTVGFQYLYASELLANGTAVHFQPAAPATNSITGTLTCGGVGVEGATVTAAGRSATTDADGTYRVDGVPARTVQVLAYFSGGDCVGTRSRSVLVGRDAPVVDFDTPATVTGAGYRITETPITYTPLPATAVLGGGNGTYYGATIPFPVRVFDKTYTKAYVGVSGEFRFGPDYDYDHVCPFYNEDWSTDDDALFLAGVRGTAPHRQWVVEWRDMVLKQDSSATRHTFQTVFDEGGGVSFVYPSNDGSFVKAGGAALIGVTDHEDRSTIVWSDQLPALRPGYGLRFDNVN